MINWRVFTAWQNWAIVAFALFIGASLLTVIHQGTSEGG